MTKGRTFCLLFKTGLKIREILKMQFFFKRLLVLLALTNWPHFCFVEALMLGVFALCLAIDLTIDKAESIGREVIINISRYFL